MPRFLVECAFPTGLHIPLTEKGATLCRRVIDTNKGNLTTWVHTYVSRDKATPCCVYDAPSPEAIRRAARRNGLPVATISAVQILDPYFCR